MKAQPPLSLANFLVFTFVFASTMFLQGCDSPMAPDASEEFASANTQNPKLRHAGLLDSARRTRPGQAGKSAASATDLFLAFNEYEANGVTKRVLNRYEITTRILEEYGITRRVLNQYGITKRILDQYGITRRVLNQYGITKRILDQYGITRRILGKYSNDELLEILDEFDIDEAKLAEDGLTMQDLEEFNKLSALLEEYGLTLEEFIAELESYLSAIRLKVYVDGAHLGITISLDTEILKAFLEEIGDDPDILFAEPDAVFDTTDLGTIVDGGNKAQITPWGITSVASPLLNRYEEKDATYQQVDVFILDSGALPDHEWSDLNYVTKKDFTMLFENPDQLLWDENNAPDISGFDPDSAGNPLDGTGHGVHVAGTIGAHNNKLGVVGVASGARLHSLKVLTDEGRTDITTLLAAVDYVTRAKRANPQTPVVVNMSLGVDIGTTSYNILDEAIAHSIAEGVIYVAAAGNSGRDASTYSPAHVDEVITVGAYNEAGALSSFSNYGPVVDILAPGENIISLSHLISETKNMEAILASGTSFAAPHVTGAVARYLGDNPDARASEVAEALKTTATSELTDLPGNTANRALHVSNLLGETDTLNRPDNDRRN